MSQEEIINLLQVKPRLTTKEIANELGKQKSAVSKCIYNLIDANEIKSFVPNKKDLERISQKYPQSIKKAHSRLKVFELNYDS